MEQRQLPAPSPSQALWAVPSKRFALKAQACDQCQAVPLPIEDRRLGPEVRLQGLFLEFGFAREVGWWQGSASISLEQPVHLGRVPEKAPKEIG